jgi:hypothetical protein
VVAVEEYITDLTEMRADTTCLRIKIITFRKRLQATRNSVFTRILVEEEKLELVVDSVNVLHLESVCAGGNGDEHNERCLNGSLKYKNITLHPMLY